MQEQALAAALRFSAWAQRPAPMQRLDEGALLVAEVRAPGLDHRRYIRYLDTLAAEVWADLGPATRLLRGSHLQRRSTADRVLGAMTDVLVRRRGFHGAEDDYYTPQNSFLDQVLTRREGLPITLSVIYLEVARRLGAPLQGVGLPVRFMVKWPLTFDEGGDIYLDAYDSGELYDEPTCRQFILRLMRPHVPHEFDVTWARPLPARDILTRMLHNLKLVYLQQGDTARALEVVDRLTTLRPDLPQELRDRGLLRLALGEPLLAAADIATYLERAPNAPENDRLRRRVQSVREVRVKLN